jgi:hypothetical protein
MADRIHVVPYGGKWGIHREGAREFLDTFATQEEAIDAGARWAELNGAELLIHVTKAHRVRRRRASKATIH